MQPQVLYRSDTDQPETRVAQSDELRPNPDDGAHHLLNESFDSLRPGVLEGLADGIANLRERPSVSQICRVASTKMLLILVVA